MLEERKCEVRHRTGEIRKPRRERREVLTHLELPFQVQHALHAVGPLAARLVLGFPYLHDVGSRAGRPGGMPSMW